MIQVCYKTRYLIMQTTLKIISNNIKDKGTLFWLQIWEKVAIKLESYSLKHMLISMPQLCLIFLKQVKFSQRMSQNKTSESRSSRKTA